MNDFVEDESFRGWAYSFTFYGVPYYWFGVKGAFGSIKWAIQTS